MDVIIKNLPETFQQLEDHLDFYQDELVLPKELKSQSSKNSEKSLKKESKL